MILEIGPANGDLSYAKDVVHAAVESGAHWVKGQIYDRDLLTTKPAKSYAQEGITVPDLQYDGFEKQLTLDEWAEVAELCKHLGIGFFFSVFDSGGIRFGQQIGVRRYKIASGDITYAALIEAVASTGKTVILSTGASTEDEIRRAVGWITVRNTNLVVLACTLAYPCRPEWANLSRIKTLRPIWPEIGYSDHTFGVGALHRAHHWGAVMVEKHFTITPGAGGDHDFAVTPKQLQQIISWTTGDPLYDGDGVLEPLIPEEPARIGARRSLFVTRDVPEGDVLTEADLIALRPGGGIEPWQMDDYLNRPVKESVLSGEALQPSMF